MAGAVRAELSPKFQSFRADPETELEEVAVGIAEQEARAESQLPVRQASRGQARPTAGARRVEGAMPQVAGARAPSASETRSLARTSGGHGPAVARREVLEELDARARRRAQRRDAQARAEDVVQVLLLGAVVLALAGDAQAERVAVEARGSRSVSPTTMAVWSMPRKSSSVGAASCAIALARREREISRTWPSGSLK